MPAVAPSTHPAHALVHADRIVSPAFRRLRTPVVTDAAANAAAHPFLPSACQTSPNFPASSRAHAHAPALAHARTRPRMRSPTHTLALANHRHRAVCQRSCPPLPSRRCYADPRKGSGFAWGCNPEILAHDFATPARFDSVFRKAKKVREGTAQRFDLTSFFFLTSSINLEVIDSSAIPCETYFGPDSAASRCCASLRF